ncbi:branched-chain amino acid ABC transporter permease [Bradyrhizobium sp. SZCCHNRI1073]|uniref:branched-chain amino acid ABC transporter permease n=1 Tax=Bradyrhizobium sp. SZCCHNRI1073 TaxID=3057280 RepID=UPI00291630D9|nr:branched-chain amino acid ABC transporter permease [Bradyrhizobium sp. SZCCHNRI1073]
MLDAVIQGILLGGYYAILASGLSLLFGVARLINLAHGDLAILGAYLVLALVRRGIDPFLACAPVLLIMAALGWFMHKWLFVRTMRGGILLPLLTTFGMSAAIQNGLQGVFGSDAASLGNHIGDLSWESFELPFGIAIGKLPLLTFATAIAVLGTLQLVLSRSRFGRALRATSQDAEAARLSGIDAEKVQCGAAAIAVALAGLAGVFLAMRALINPYSGPAELIYAFEAVVIGGIGSLWGTLIGGIVLGIAQCVGAALSPQGFQLAGHVVFLIWLGAKFYSAGSGATTWRRLLLKWGWT